MSAVNPSHPAPCACSRCEYSTHQTPMCVCGHCAWAHLSIGYVTEDCRRCECPDFRLAPAEDVA